MISIFLKEENSIINLDKIVYTQIHYENVFKQPNDYQYTKQFSANVVFEDGSQKEFHHFMIIEQALRCSYLVYLIK
jgi:hypothetical protein